MQVAEFAKNFGFGSKNLRNRKSWRLPLRLSWQHLISLEAGRSSIRAAR